MSEASKSFHNKLENRLWTFVLPWLETDPQAHRLVHQAARLKTNLSQRSYWVRILFWISLGFTLGLGIGMLAALLT